MNLLGNCERKMRINEHFIKRWSRKIIVKKCGFTNIHKGGTGKG
jgi:hypothetical protein